MSIHELILTLEQSIKDAEHKPEDWASSPNEMGAIVSRSSLNQFWQLGEPLSEGKPWAHFHYKRDGWLAIAAVNALPKLISYIRELEQQNASRTTASTN